MDNALQTGASGMLADQTWMDAIGNNIANSSTTGYKSEQVDFADTLSQLMQGATSPSSALGGQDPVTLGTGVSVSADETNFTQGTMQSTGNATDIAVNGSGFIAVTDGSNIYYTRDGGLGLDANGNLVQLASGYKVLAEPAGAASSDAPTVTPSSTLQLPVGQSTSARATSEITLGGNIDSGLTASQPYSITSQVYDSLGAAHNLTLTFTPAAAAGSWTVAGTVDGGTVQVGNGQVTFDSSGNPTTTSLPITVQLNGSTNATQSQNIAVSLSGVTQLANTSNAALVSQDGLAPGTLTGVSFNSDGSIVGTYSNGLTDTVGQLVTATFSNNEGLQSTGNNLYQSTSNSGSATYGAPGSAGRGEVQSGVLEGSNVNLTSELSNMIIAERSFQANSQTITVQNQMMQQMITMMQG